MNITHTPPPKNPYWRRVWLGLVLTCAALLCLPIALLNSQGGFAWATHALLHYCPKLHIAHISGSLANPSVTGLQYQDTHITLTAKQVTLRWSPMQLLKGRLVIQSLHLEALCGHGQLPTALKTTLHTLGLTDLTQQSTPTINIDGLGQWSATRGDGDVHLRAPHAPQLNSDLHWQQVNQQLHWTLTQPQLNPLWHLKGAGHWHAGLSHWTWSTPSTTSPALLQTQGHIDATPTPAWQFSATLHPAAQPKRTRPTWAGRLYGERRGQIMQMTLHGLRGQYLDQPLSGQGRWVQDAKQSRGDLSLRLGKATFNTHAEHARQADQVTWTLHLPDLSDWQANWHGVLQSKAHLRRPALAAEQLRTFTTWQGQATLQAQHLSLGQQHYLGHLTAQFAPSAPAPLRMTLAQLQTPYLKLQQATLTATPPTPSKPLCLKLHLQPQRQTLALKLQARPLAQTWQGQLTQLSLTDQTLGRWALTNPVNFTWQPHKHPTWQLDPIHLVQALGQVTVRLKQKNELITLALDSQDLPLSLLTPWLPERTQATLLEGQLKTHLTLNIRPNQQPDLHGWLNLTNGHIRHQAAGLELTPVQLQLTANNQQLIGQLSAQSGKGLLSASSQTQLIPPYKTLLKLKGEDFLISHTPKLTLRISPDLTLQIANQHYQLTGHLGIPSGHLEWQHAPATHATHLPGDVVFVSHYHPEPQHKKPYTLDLESNITVDLGPQVSLKAKGLTGQLSGHLKLEDHPRRLTRANGQIIIHHGLYEAYGQVLDVTQGRLHFAGGPIDNPHVNLIAVRKIKPNQLSSMTNASLQTAQVGIHISGRLKHLQTRLFSEPADKSQADILAILLFGQTAAQINESKDHAALLFQAASGLNIGGRNHGLSDLTQSLKHTLGLSELNIESRSVSQADSDAITQSAALVIGKYLSPKLYIRYSLGLLDSNNLSTLNLRYRLNRYFILQSQTNLAGSGVDLLYTVDQE